MNLATRTLFKIAGSLSSVGKEAYRNDYDLRAGKYDLVETRPILRSVTEKLLAQMDLHPGMHCMDLGCGTGHATEIIAKRVLPTGSVTGCDCSSEMLRIANRNLGLELPFIKFVHKDMLEFLGECEDGTADFISAFWSADYCNYKKLVPELNRVLKQNGIVTILINTQESLGELQKLVVQILLKHPLYIKNIPPINFPRDVEHFGRCVSRSGIVIKRLDEEGQAYKFKSGPAVVKWLQDSGPAAGIVSALKSHCIDKFFSCIEEAVDKQGGLTITFRFLVFVGRKQAV